MRTLAASTNEFESSRRRRLRWLIAGRMAAILLLVGAGALWARESSTGLAGLTAHGSVHAGLMLAIVASLTALYALALRFSKIDLDAQAAVQFFCDVLLVTWLVWATGDLHSPYVALYIVVISLASIFLGARAALVTSVGCAASYTAAMLSTAAGWLPGDAGGEALSAPMSRVVGTVGLNDVGILVVGLLADWLARRQSRSDVQLIEAAHKLADLRALHERIVESIRSGVVTTDLQGRIYTFNAAAEEMTGYTAASLRGQHVSILFGEISSHIEDSMRAAAEGETSPRFEADCLTAEGLRVRLGYSIFPLSTEGGETTGLVITFQDLTHIRTMEETTRRQDKLAAVGRVAAGIAHEVRNPLASMRGSIQVLRSEMQADPSQAELMEIVLRESDRLNRIITDFLTYARPRTPSLAEIDLREPLRETFTLLRHSPEIREGHTLEESLPEEPVRAMADAASIKQVFWNLARNALAAMPEGGRLRAELARAEHGRVHAQTARGAASTSGASPKAAHPGYRSRVARNPRP